ncbi:hypothetical protein O3G_MSEX002669 [Manduca sexta]|uniref:BESS domain-containing protein n=1 Tax=Manduca sexta TaxID=7130 RepID=A0A921YPH9_MANSE|nr:hypothetical protein O3G_MSEX002669 [Manduca sexta]
MHFSELVTCQPERMYGMDTITIIYYKTHTFVADRKLHGKWRNIRDSYVRHIKRKYGKRGYMYAKNLSFLENIYKQNSNSGSDIDADNNDDTWASDAEDTKHNKLYLKKGLDIKSDNWLSEEEPENVKRKRKSSKRKELEYVESPFPEAACSYSVAEDDDRSFFESLLPAVRSFDLDQKLEFRSNVIAIVKSIRSNNGKFKIDPGSVDDE